jgi:hypothetical protein
LEVNVVDTWAKTVPPKENWVLRWNSVTKTNSMQVKQRVAGNLALAFTNFPAHGRPSIFAFVNAHLN